MTADRLPIERIGRYRVVGRLGAGGMGTVYRALDETLQREVAVKVLESSGGPGDDERLERFLREARALAALSHPNIAAVLDVGQEKGTAYLVMELVEGSSLRACLRAGSLSHERVLRAARDVAAGLAAAHARGIVHRDVKPDNVVLGEGGRAKLVDFGLAKAVAPTPDSAPPAEGALTVEGAILGTPQYMAPEQARGAAIDPRADVFSFGALVYELVAGRPAFAASSLIEALVLVQTEEPPPLDTLVPTVPSALSAFVHRCLAKDPAARPVDGAALSAALEGLRWDDTTVAPDAALGLAETVASSESLDSLKARSGARPAPVPDTVARSAAAVETPFASSLTPAKAARRPPWAVGLGLAGVVVAAGVAHQAGWLGAPPPAPEAGTAPPREAPSAPAPPRITPLAVDPVAGAGHLALRRDGRGVFVVDRDAIRSFGWDGVAGERRPIGSDLSLAGEVSDGRLLVVDDGELLLVDAAGTTTPTGEGGRRARVALDGRTVAVEGDDALAVGPYEDPANRTVVHRTALPILFSWSPDSSRLVVGELEVTGSRRDVSLFIVGADGTRGPVIDEGVALAGPFGPSLGWRDVDTILYARHGVTDAEIVERDVDAAGRAVSEPRVVLAPWTLGFPTELAVSGEHLALVATRETRTVLEASVTGGTLAAPRTVIDDDGLLQPVGFLPDGARVVASFEREWTIAAIGEGDRRSELARVPGDSLAASVADDALIFLRPAGARRWEVVRAAPSGETLLLDAEAVPACDAPLVDCHDHRCVLASGSGTELELLPFDAVTGVALGEPCVAAPGASGSVRAISLEPSEPLAVVFSRNGDHRLVRVVLDGCSTTEREIESAALQFVAAADGGAVLATSTSRGSSERRLVRISAGADSATVLLSENAWLYRPVLSAGADRVLFGRRNDRVSAFVVELGGTP